MRFGFVTCVQLGLSCMEAIYDVGGQLDLAITLEDDMGKEKSGRIYLDQFCAAKSLDLVKVRNINKPESVIAIRDYGIDWLFIIGWSQIARKEVLSTPSRGVIGMHPTLLPVGRGRAAIPWAILKKLDKTGVTMFQLDQGVDTGPIIAHQEIALGPKTTATELYQAVDETHVSLMKDVFPMLRDEKLEPQKQDDTKASEWHARKPEDGRIDLSGSVADAERLVRAVTHPYPGAFAELPEGRLVIWSAEVAGEGITSSVDSPRIAFHDGVMIATDWSWSDSDG